MHPHQAKKIYILLAVVLAAVSIVFLSLQQSQPGVPQAPGRLTIVTTIFPLADIVQNVAGNDVTVVQLLSAGASPHTHTLTPQQLLAIEQADAIFAIGHGLDDWVVTSLDTETVPIIVDSNIALREFSEADHDHGDDGQEESIDPHYWLTVPNAATIAETITKELQAQDPAFQDTYAQNLAAYQAQLTELEEELQVASAAAPRKDFIAIHDAWSYFANHYGFNLLATYEPVEGREPSLADIAELQTLVTEHNISTFFSEPQKDATSTTRFLRDEFGLTISILDPIGGTGERNSYVNLMRTNLQVLTDQL